MTKGTCSQGHELTAGNVTVSGRRKRCLQCKREYAERMRRAQGVAVRAAAGANWQCTHDPLTSRRPGRIDCAPCHREREKARYHANREQQIAAATRWQRENRERRRAYYRSWATGNRWGKGTVTGEAKREAMCYIGMISRDPCVYCGRPCEHIDHILPVRHGGTGEWGNLAPTCQHCNQSKNARSVLHFMLARSEAA